MHVDDILEEEALFTAPRSPFFKPQAKGGVRTGKRYTVAQILLFDLATAAPATPRQAPGPETGSDAEQLRHGSELLTYPGSMLLKPGPRTCTECSLDIGGQQTFSAAQG